MLGRTVRVGGYRPNAFGLYDMHGNVWEWCWDVFDAYHKNAPESDPAGPSGDSHRDRINRGGCFAQPTKDSRAAARGWSTPTWRSNALAFRVARGSGE